MYARIVEKLAAGEQVVLTPTGNSMTPRIKSGQRITLAAIDRFKVGDVVLAKVKSRYYIHLLTALDGNRVQISNNHHYVNGWTTKDRVYGRVLDV